MGCGLILISSGVVEVFGRHGLGRLGRGSAAAEDRLNTHTKRHWYGNWREIRSFLESRSQSNMEVRRMPFGVCLSEDVGCGHLEE
jgi:hypothetical protein